MSKTKLEILVETINYYEPHPERRALKGMSCAYLNPEGKRCAVGRCLQTPLPNSDGSVLHGNTTALEECLMPEYRGHEHRFWSDLQAYHDSKFGTDAGCDDLRAAYVGWLFGRYADLNVPTFVAGKGLINYPITPETPIPKTMEVDAYYKTYGVGAGPLST